MQVFYKKKTPFLILIPLIFMGSLLYGNITKKSNLDITDSISLHNNKKLNTTYQSEIIVTDGAVIFGTENIFFQKKKSSKEKKTENILVKASPKKLSRPKKSLHFLY